MSVGALDRVLNFSESEGGSRLVLIVLAEAMNFHEGDEGWETCWPSKAWIAHKAKLSERQVQRCVAELVELGELISEPHPFWTGRQDRKPNRYRLRGDNLTPRVRPNGETYPSNGETSATERGDAGVSQTMREPESKNHEDDASAPPSLLPLGQPPTKAGGKNAREYTREFDEAWAFYPKKERKPEAFNAWKARLRQNVTVDQLMTATRNYAAKCQRDQTPAKYVMHGATFYGPNERWCEYASESSTASTEGESIFDKARREAREAAAK